MSRTQYAWKECSNDAIVNCMREAKYLISFSKSVKVIWASPPPPHWIMSWSRLNPPPSFGSSSSQEGFLRSHSKMTLKERLKIKHVILLYVFSFLFIDKVLIFSFGMGGGGLVRERERERRLARHCYHEGGKTEACQRDITYSCMAIILGHWLFLIWKCSPPNVVLKRMRTPRAHFLYARLWMSP